MVCYLYIVIIKIMHNFICLILYDSHNNIINIMTIHYYGLATTT